MMLAPCNFKNQITGEISIASLWRKDAIRRDLACQTGELQTCDQESQTVISALQDVNRKDEKVGNERKPTQASLDGLQYVYTGVEYDDSKLATFLEESKEDILTMLYRNAKSTAFDGYDPNWSQKSSDVALVHTLSSPYAVESDLHALSASWSSNGSLLAVGYGRLDTTGWCPGGGVVGIWNLIRSDVDASAPHHTLETDAHVTSVAFHPVQASVLAVGLYSGTVLLYSGVTDRHPSVLSSDAAAVAHRDPVTALHWAQCPQELRDSHRYLLCSAAQDGRILFWSPTARLAAPAAAFLVRGTKKGGAAAQGVAAFAHVRRGLKGGVADADAVMLVGLESGDVGRASAGPVSSAAPRPQDAQPAPLGVDWLAGHKGPVQSVDASPFFHNLCLTCSSDGVAHLRNVLERAPLATLQPSVETKHFLYDARFSPFRPSVFAVVSRSSFMHLYDVQASPSKPIASVEAGVDGAPVLCVAFNHVSPEWIVTGDMRGCVRLWRLPSSLFQTTELERNAIRSGSSHGSGSGGGGGDAVRALFGFTL